MIVTIMSDASFCPKTKASGWGVWAKSERGSFSAGGNFKSDPGHSTDAEAMAIAVAVFAAFRQGVAAAGDRLIIQTDCMTMVRAYTGHHLMPKLSREKNKTLESTIKYTRKLIKSNKCEFEVRHVEAHAPSKGKRNFVNNICDAKAKEHMTMQRKERVA